MVASLSRVTQHRRRRQAASNCYRTFSAPTKTAGLLALRSKKPNETTSGTPNIPGFHWRAKSDCTAALPDVFLEEFLGGRHGHPLALAVLATKKRTLREHRLNLRKPGRPREPTVSLPKWPSGSSS